MKRLLPVIIVFSVLLGAGAVFIGLNSSSDPPESSNPITSTPNLVTVDQKLIIGSANAPVTIVEYFDYKCPSCNNFHHTTGQQIQTKFVDTGQANFEIRITPILGPDSGNAARGAYCANDQNQFVNYHNSVIEYMWDNYYADSKFSAEGDNILTTGKLAEISEPLGIDIDKFKSCVDSKLHNDKLDQNLLLAAEDEIRGTPGFAIGEQTFVGGQPFNVFETLINIELQK